MMTEAESPRSTTQETFPDGEGPRAEEKNEIRQLVMAIGSIILISALWWLMQ
jgi:hypothetical protein